LTATLEQLTQLPGIGKVLAKRLIEYRNTHGPFTNPQDITKVKGIGAKTYDKIKNKIILSASKFNVDKLNPDETFR
jgi:competence protein ComEA